MRSAILVAVIVVTALPACETTPKAPIAAAPTCQGDTDCTAKWAAARTFVVNHARFKFQTYSPDYMDTYNPPDSSPGLAAQVNKEPLPDGGFRITAKFWCANMFGCNPDQWATLDQFNREVAAVGSSGAGTR